MYGLIFGDNYAYNISFIHISILETEDTYLKQMLVATNFLKLVSMIHNRVLVVPELALNGTHFMSIMEPTSTNHIYIIKNISQNLQWHYWKSWVVQHYVDLLSRNKISPKIWQAYY